MTNTDSYETLKKSHSFDVTFVHLFIFRLITSLLNQSYYHPDEFWQSLEVAHHDVFGYGYLTWEWNSNKPLRSPVYNFGFVIIYHFLKIFNLDFPFFVAYAPKILQALCASIFDYFLLKLTDEFVGSFFRINTLIFNYTCWFSVSLMSRSLVNAYETSLFTVALYYWKLGMSKRGQKLVCREDLMCRLFVGINFFARSTSLAVWTLIWVDILNRNAHETFYYAKALGTAVLYSHKKLERILLICLISYGIDYTYYGFPTWTAWNFFEVLFFQLPFKMQEVKIFLKFNVINKGSANFGSQHFLFFFKDALPSILLGFSIFYLYGVYFYAKRELEMRRPPILLALSLYLILIVSLPEHKEARFLMPILPLMTPILAVGYSSFPHKRLRRIVFIAGLVSQAAFYIYYAFFYHIGGMRVMNWIRNNPEGMERVFFIANCHLGPFYCYTHNNIPMKFIQCLTPPDKADKISYSRYMNEHLDYIEDQLKFINHTHVVTDFQYFDDEKIINMVHSMYEKIVCYLDDINYGPTFCIWKKKPKP